MYQRYRNINLNKIQRSNERVSQDKESLERHNDSLQNKRSANSLHSLLEFWAVSCKSSSKKNMLVDKISRKTSINSEKRVRKYVALLTGGEDWLDVN